MQKNASNNMGLGTQNGKEDMDWVSHNAARNAKRGAQTAEKGAECLTFLIYNIHEFVMLGVTIHQHWPVWLSFIIIGVLIIQWGCFTSKYGTTHNREMIYVSLFLVCLILYSMQIGALTNILIPFASIVVLLGLSNYPDLIYTTVIALIYLVLYHGLVIHSIRFSGFDDFLEYGIPLLNIILIQGVIYFWMKKRKESGQTMDRVIEELKGAERAKDDFLANVSHEIRTPINTINGMSEVILQEELTDEVREKVINVQNAGRNLMTVVGDILDFSELQSGKVEIVEEKYNITSTINDIINMSMAQKAGKNIELVVDCDPNLPRGLVGDEKKLRRIIMNLVNNAIKFTDEGGVSIDVTFRKEFYGINLIFTVRDSGIGMDQESVEKLFTTYNQVDMSRSRAKGGVGLGLAISRAIVKGMGGVITIRSQLGEGTSIRVTIPQKVADERPIIELAGKEKLNVLIYFNLEQIVIRDVRDGYSNALYHMVERLGVSNHICHNFEELKRRAEKENYTHVFIGYSDYMAAPVYYDELAKKTNVAVVLDEQNVGNMLNNNLILIYKPFYVIPVMSVLNGHSDRKEINNRTHHQEFTTPEVKVLIVDDNEMNIRVVQGLLAKYKIKTVQALSGMEALEKVESKDYDLIFMDHMMPEMDGIEALHRIRGKGGSYYANVPIIALTANAIAGAREMFLSEGFTDFVEKPVDNSVLERVLQRNLNENLLVYNEQPVKKKVAQEEESRLVMDMEKSMKKEQNQEKEPENKFVIADLDVETGQRYCGGRDSYIAILREYVRKGADNWNSIEQMYANQDWKNYVIAVHAVKSSMLAIGAKPLSELAKKLELAGKEDNIAYILENHDTMIAEYKRLMEDVGSSSYIGIVPKKEETAVNLLDLSDAQFEEKTIAFENAMYDLDGNRMLQILDELSTYAYHGSSLAEPLAAVRRKVELSDYMSAVEAVLRIKDKLKKEDAGEKNA